MSEEFKTLKDFNFKAFGIEDRLKAEAIKWWKKNNCGDDMCCTCEEMWRDFFNITEEDLK